MTPSPSATDTAAGHPRRQLILVIMCLSLVLIVAAVSSLNVAIPTIVRELQPSSTEQLWIIDSYALVFAGLLLFCGALGDRYGRKHALIVGMLIFAGASILAAYADSPTQLIAFRGLSGIGAALIMPATLSTISVVFPPDERAKAIAVWAGLAGAGGAIGPVASGLLLEWFWWGSIFFVAVPIVAIALVGIIAVVPNSAELERHPLDYVGALLSVVMLVSLVFGIVEGPESGWLAGITLGAFAVGIVTLGLYLWWERRVEYPLLDPRHFLIPRFGLGSLTITFAFFVMFGMFFLITLYMQFVLGWSALGAAVRLLPFSVVMIIVAPRNPILTERFGSRQVIAAGFIVQASGFLIAATAFQPDSAYWVVLFAVIPMALGMALLMPPTTNAIISALPQDKAGVASAVNDTTREVGGALGIALMGTLMTIGYQAGIEGTDGLPVELAELAEDSVGGAFQVASQLEPAAAGPLIESASSAYLDGTTFAFGLAGVVSLIMAGVITRFYPSDDAA